MKKNSDTPSATLNIDSKHSISKSFVCVYVLGGKDIFSSINYVEICVNRNIDMF